MIKVLADKVLAFDRGEKDSEGQLIRVKTNIGFCELPDWVAKTDYYKAAIKDGSLKSFVSAGESEAVLKEQEKLAALKAEVAAMEEKREQLAYKSQTKKNAKGKEVLEIEKLPENEKTSETDKPPETKNTNE